MCMFVHRNASYWGAVWRRATAKEPLQSGCGGGMWSDTGPRLRSGSGGRNYKQAQLLHCGDQVLVTFVGEFCTKLTQPCVGKLNMSYALSEVLVQVALAWPSRGPQRQKYPARTIKMAAAVWSTSPSLLESMMSTSTLEDFLSQVVNLIRHITELQGSWLFGVGYNIHFIDSVHLHLHLDASLSNFSPSLCVSQGAPFGFQWES